MSKRPTPGVIEIDIRPIWEAFTNAARFVTEAMRDFQELLLGGTERRDRRVRMRYGLGNGGPVIWRSDMCAVFLHDDCGTQAICTCGCHR